jgi:hypothetical protein
MKITEFLEVKGNFCICKHIFCSNLRPEFSDHDYPLNVVVAISSETSAYFTTLELTHATRWVLIWLSFFQNLYASVAFDV